MTTNHRPTLESKKGKRQGIRDTIAHARALPQQNNLKYRKKLPTKLTEDAVNQLKIELLQSESGKGHAAKDVRETQEKSEDEVTSTGASDDSDYNSDSDVDDQELLQELANIKKEKEALKREAAASVKTANPLLDLGDDPRPKKSWRDSTAFNTKKPTSNDSNDNFTTDALNSDAHKSFLNKYVR